jgi:hypothetical protein
VEIRDPECQLRALAQRREHAEVIAAIESRICRDRPRPFAPISRRCIVHRDLLLWTKRSRQQTLRRTLPPSCLLLAFLIFAHGGRLPSLRRCLCRPLQAQRCRRIFCVDTLSEEDVEQRAADYIACFDELELHRDMGSRAGPAADDSVWSWLLLLEL